MMQCERCGQDGATPCDIAVVQPDGAAPLPVPFVLCPSCQAFAASIAPLQSEDELTDDSAWLASIEPIIELAQDIAAMQREVDQLRARLSEKKKVLRLKVRRLDESLHERQWRRMIDEQQLAGETAAVFWLEKYRRR
jgi:uncharacterized small protein (DUF1192 family)